MVKKANMIGRNNICTDPVKFKSELQKVADELGIPIEDRTVPVEWCKRGNSYNEQLFIEVIFPLYYPSSEGWVLKFDEYGAYADNVN